MAAQFFKAVVFHLPNSWPAERAEQLRLALESHGGKAASTIADATHIITNTDRFEGWHDVKDRISVVTVRKNISSLAKVSSRSGHVGRAIHQAGETAVVRFFHL